jgi:hypothetical protein
VWECVGGYVGCGSLLGVSILSIRQPWLGLDFSAGPTAPVRRWWRVWRQRRRSGSAPEWRRGDGGLELTSYANRSVLMIQWWCGMSGGFGVGVGVVCSGWCRFVFSASFAVALSGSSCHCEEPALTVDSPLADLVICWQSTCSIEVSPGSLTCAKKGYHHIILAKSPPHRLIHLLPFWRDHPHLSCLLFTLISNSASW